MGTGNTRRGKRATNTGLGIGLAVCKRLVEAMGGTIWARSRDGGGADVGFELPLSTEQEGAPLAATVEFGVPADAAARAPAAMR